MLRHYLTVTLRSLHRDLSYTVLNVAGLGVALAACIVIGLYVRHEQSYDRFFPNADRVYRFFQSSLTGETEAAAPPGLAQALETDAPGIEAATVVDVLPDERVFSRGRETFKLNDVFRADTSFFEVFPYDVRRGSAATALQAPGSVVLTASLAERLFGDADPVGQRLVYDDWREPEELTVTAVMEDPPTNAHIRPQMLLSLSEEQRARRYGSSVLWSFFGGSLYLELRPQSDPADVMRAVDALPGGGSSMATLGLEPVPDIHLRSDVTRERKPQSDVRYLYLFSTVGLLILLIACVNYVNFATARAARRSREIGVRKALGAGRGHLQRQLLSEAVVLCALALPVALLLAAVALPVLSRIAGLPLTLAGLADPVGVGSLLVLVLVVGLGAGIYPAFVLARFRPVQALRGQGVGGSRSFLRSGLTVFQMGAAVLLVVCTLVVQRQLEHIRTFRLGFDQSHVVSFDIPPDTRESFGTFRQELLRDPAVEAVTFGIPMGKGYANGKRPPDPAVGRDEWLTEMVVGPEYVETMGLTLIAGQGSPTTLAYADSAVVLTESAARYYGSTPAEVIGEQVFGDRVIGIVRDVHNASLREAIGPVHLMLSNRPSGYGIARFRPGAADAGLAAMERAWTTLSPERPFSVSFLDDEIEAQYRAEHRLARVFGLFSGLALFIAGLGLLGLMAYMVQQRRKEIGIRKVLGASVSAIVGLLTGEVGRLAALALLVTVPLGLILSRRWLESFAFPADIGVGVFLGAGAVLLATVLLAVGWQAWRAATADPVRALRSE